jgi:hypothetical protein
VAIRKAVADLRALGMSRERARQQAEAEERKGLGATDVLLVDDEGNIEPRPSRKSILDS